LCSREGARAALFAFPRKYGLNALERLVAPSALEGGPLEVVTHVGRDILANASYFATIPKAVYEYVSNSIDATPSGRACVVRVTLATRARDRRIQIADDASGMSREELRAFFTMHGENLLRRAGRKVRGRFGTGKIAAFGRADVLRVDTVQDGVRNVVELGRSDLEDVLAGRPIRVRELLVDEPTDERAGTVVTIAGLHRGARVDRAEIVRYLQRQLGRHLARHEVYVDGERVAYVEPVATDEFAFAAPEELTLLAGTPLSLVVKVASRPLAEEENGVAILCNGFLNAMTLAGLAGKPEAEYLFGEVEVSALDDDAAEVPAFLATRDLTLNPENPLVAELQPWLRSSLDGVRRELVRRAHERRRAAEERELRVLGDQISGLLSSIYRGERATLLAPPRPEPLPVAPLEPVVVAPLGVTRAPRKDRGVPRGPRPPRPTVEAAPLVEAVVPAIGLDREPLSVHVLFRHVGDANLRAFYVREERGIVMNLDHPEAVASLGLGGPTSPFFAHYCFRTAMEEFTLAMVAELGYPDAPEIAREIRERSDRYARAMAPQLGALSLPEPPE